MRVFNKIVIFLAVVIATFNTEYISAHERFIVPSHTVLSGDKPQSVTMTASISNAIFHPDRPFGDNGKGVDVGDLKNLFKLLQGTVISPDGKVDSSLEFQAFKRLSVADVDVFESGTYRIGLVQPNTQMTTFKKNDGTSGRLFGKNPQLPKGATHIVRRTTSSRVESFVSVNEPNRAAVKPTGKGLELSGISHPNDLFEGETAQFQLFFNGKPAEGIKSLKFIKAGTRHRNNRNEKIIPVSDKGEFELEPQEAGFYFLAATTSIKVAQPADVDVRHFSLYLTLEVFPQ